MKEDLQKPDNQNAFKNQHNNEPSEEQKQFIQYPYRWVIVGLMGFCLVINGLANNTVIPIASKLASVYKINDAYVSSPVIVSFLVYSLTNFPANHFIDSKGLRTSFLIGSALYMIGIFLYVEIDRGYYFTIMGSIFVATGQPFIINCPAKVATYWFLDKNRTFATAIMTGTNFLGTAFGFVLPTLIVHQQSTVDQAKKQIFYLYACQFFISALCFFLVYVFMRKAPPTLPSIGAQQQKTPVIQSLKLIKKNKSLWIFFSGYIILYGTLLSFGSTANLLFKPYGFEDIQIALLAVILIIFGVIGSISISLYIKYTTNYKRAIRLIPSSSLLFMILTCLILNTINNLPLTFVMVGCIGFCFSPLVPISYDLGCELCFPIGQAQVIGILNGGAFIFTFILTIITTSTVSFENKKNSLTVLIIYIVLITIGTIIYFFIKIDLKRRNAQKQGHILQKQIQIKQIQMVKNNIGPYQNFVQQKHKNQDQQIEI